MNKKGFELSANFVVIIIISIIVFTIGIYMLNRFFSFATEEKLRWDDMTRKEIDTALDRGERVAIPRFKRTLVNGEFTSLGVGILNVLQGSPRDFRITIDFALASRGASEVCTSADPGTCGNPDTWIKTVYDSEAPIDFNLTISNNEKKDFLVGFDVQGAPIGTYAFNVNVEYYDTGWRSYDTIHKIYLDIK